MKRSGGRTAELPCQLPSDHGRRVESASDAPGDDGVLSATKTVLKNQGGGEIVHLDGGDEGEETWGAEKAIHEEIFSRTNESLAMPEKSEAVDGADNPYASPLQDCRPLIGADLPFHDGGALSARFTYTSDYFIETLTRYHAQRKGRKLWFVGRLLVILASAVAAFAAYRQREYGGGMIAAIFLIVMIFGQRIDNWRARRIFASSPLRDLEITLRLSEAGVHELSSVEDSKLKWAVFTKVVYFDDGALLFQGPQLVRWIPFASLAPGVSPQQLESLLNSKIFHQVDRRKGTRLGQRAPGG